MKKLLLAGLLTTGLTMTLPALAADEFNVGTGLTAAGAPLALNGVDPVAFIDIGNRAEGRAEYTAVHNGVAYYFSTQANLEKFEDNASHYLPQNGGFCTLGVSIGKKLDGNPQYADVIDGKLYLFLNEDVYKTYQKNPRKVIKTANAQWAKIEHKAVTSL